MELKPKTTEEYIVGAEREMEFSIDTDSHIIFEILRDKMYSDKIGAVAREVASNSRDANREAGNTDIPVEVQIVKPNKFASIGHQSIVFKDNGVGITPDRMSDVFIKYASSTKRDSNNETGGFGLGAKTPFAYSDTFTIITVCDYAEPIYETIKAEKLLSLEKYTEFKSMNVDMEVVEEDEESIKVLMEVAKLTGYEPVKRKEYTYSAIIDKTNKGKMILFDSEETDQPTGTRIVVPIKTDSDRYEFERKVIKYTKYWGDSIKYVGFHREKPTIKYVIDESNFAVVQDNENTTYGLIIDGINYPLNKDEVGIKNVGVGSGYKVLLKFDTGELTISANREAVQYDEDTVTLIKERYEHIKSRLIVLAQEYIDTLPTYIEACKFCYYMTEANDRQRRAIKDDYLKVLTEAINPLKDWSSHATILSNDADKLNLQFQGKPVQGSTKLVHHTIAFVKEPRYNRKIDYSSVAKVPVNETFATAPIYYANVGKNRRRNETIWKDSKVFTLILPRTTGTDQERKDELDKLMSDFDLTYTNYKDVEMVKLDYYGNGGSGKVDGEVAINYRKLYANSGHSSKIMLVDKKTKKLTKEDPKDYVYFVVPTLGEMNHHVTSSTRDKVVFVTKHANKQTMIINESAERNWIKHTGIKKLDTEYNKLYKKHKKEWDAATLKSILMAIFYDEVGRDSYRLYQFKDEIESILPKCMVGIGLFDKDREYKSYVRQDLKFDTEGLRKKLRYLVEYKYPMLFPYLDDKMGFYESNNPEPLRKVIQNYIKLLS